ncbi:uncharacterized protein FA14DRAFT_187850 [Meira miltonrushii]|uniref:Uncharacterized protein n=1 Tax=Meira miltonrushii TaxID=1280837 RepID=A0A316VN14_9BASI|nr:uncharacterized protein FA14DRAFT_187850 [Meira miltonrushii]PWN37793.1 hypothetical protein FA14DRAFT_187850 [Meira miltonrushii]
MDCFIVFLSLMFAVWSSSASQLRGDLQASTIHHFVRRELDLNATPTSSMDEGYPRAVAASHHSNNEEVQTRWDHATVQRKGNAGVSSKGPKLSEEERKKKKYECNRLCVQRYRFKYSKEGQEIAAKTLDPIEKARYDKKLEEIQKKRKQYKAKYFHDIKVGLEKNDPKAVARNLMNRIHNRQASRRWMRKKRAQQALHD